MANFPTFVSNFQKSPTKGEGGGVIISKKLADVVYGWPLSCFKKLDISVLSIWIGYQINWIISIFKVSKKMFFILSASKKLLAPLRSGIGTCSVFCHSFSVSPNVVLTCSEIGSVLKAREANFRASQNIIPLVKVALLTKKNI